MDGEQNGRQVQEQTWRGRGSGPGTEHTTKYCWFGNKVRLSYMTWETHHLPGPG